MGIVFRAEDRFPAEGDPREVAVKLIPQRLDTPQDERSMARQQFERECGAASLLSTYSQFIKVVGNDGTLLAMEYVSWPTLNRLTSEAPLPVVEAATFGATLLDGLAAMHRHGIVHRDLKPTNIFVERFTFVDGNEDSIQFKVKIADLGACLFVGVSNAAASNHERTLAGSLGYMSPEQIDAPDHVDARSDLHTVALILWEAITRRAPFVVPDVPDILAARLQAWRRSMDSVPAMPQGLDSKLYQILAKALDPFPSNRFQSAESFAAALRRFVRDRGAEMRAAVDAARLRVDKLEARARELLERVRPARDLHHRLDRTLDRIRAHKQELVDIGPQTMLKKVSSFDEMERSLTSIEAEISSLLSGAREVVNGGVDPSTAKVSPSSVDAPPSAVADLSRMSSGARWRSALGAVCLAIVSVGVGAFAGRHYFSSTVTVANAETSADPAAFVAATNPWLAVDSTWSMQTHEVTRGEFARWRPPSRRDAGASSADLAVEADALPVTDVDWFDARDFCRAIGGTLPTALVWATARGDSSTWRNSNALRPSSEPFRVNVPRLGDVSPAGFMYLLGGVREWLAQDGSDENPTRFSTIGGSYAQSAETVILLSESPSDDPMPAGGRAAQREHDLGFRCARSR